MKIFRFVMVYATSRLCRSNCFISRSYSTAIEIFLFGPYLTSNIGFLFFSFVHVFSYYFIFH